MKKPLFELVHEDEFTNDLIIWLMWLAVLDCRHL